MHLLFNALLINDNFHQNTIKNVCLYRHVFRCNSKMAFSIPLIPELRATHYSLYYCKMINSKQIHLSVNPQTPKVFRQPKTPKGVGTTPLVFAFPSEFFLNISHGYVFGVKESNGDNEKILSSLHDLENQGQTPFCMTFLISGCKHDTNSILVSILTFSRSRISKMLKKIT